jgi:hypothetical protein
MERRTARHAPWRAPRLTSAEDFKVRRSALHPPRFGEDGKRNEGAARALVFPGDEAWLFDIVKRTEVFAACYARFTSPLAGEVGEPPKRSEGGEPGGG